PRLSRRAVLHRCRRPQRAAGGLVRGARAARPGQRPRRGAVRRPGARPHRRLVRGRGRRRVSPHGDDVLRLASGRRAPRAHRLARGPASAPAVRARRAARRRAAGAAARRGAPGTAAAGGDLVGSDVARAGEEAAMTTEEWYDALTAELLAQSPFRRSEYFKRFASGTLSGAQVWSHIAQHYLLIAWFPRIFSGIHTRCDDFDVRKDCARHLLVEDLGYFEGRVG